MKEYLKLTFFMSIIEEYNIHYTLTVTNSHSFLYNILVDAIFHFFRSIIVFFRHKEVEIYPDDTVKPPVGTGLNRRAQVTLDRVWPIDKSTREIINSPERLKSVNFVAKLKRSSAKMNAQFIEYRPLTGSWVFEVSNYFCVHIFLTGL